MAVIEAIGGIVWAFTVGAGLTLLSIGAVGWIVAKLTNSNELAAIAVVVWMLVVWAYLGAT